jgi:alkylation response protein AidB-like acyl-CoA dehydrogenase
VDYDVDLRDIKFQLFDWLQTADLLESEHFADWDRDSIGMVIDEALKISREKLAPTNEDGDRSGVQLADGAVTVPPSFREAYKTVAEGGWIGAVSGQTYGGLGLPHVAGTALNEFFAGSNLSLALVFLLTRGVGALLERHGTDDMRRLYCENLYSGHWTGTMCLTEPQAGSDVGASKATAEPLGDGRYRLKGEKIFITFGDHDLTDNVIHAVLARLPDAPPGTRGLSLFLAPKFRVNDDGSLGEANDVVCASIEHKMGIHGSPTCSILFGGNDGCEARLIGEAGRGMPLMFEMMNTARIEVGLQGAAVAGAAHQAALSYARERVQSRLWNGERGAGPVAIVEHPDVRRMLFTSGAYVSAMRALLLRTALEIDRSEVLEGEAAEHADALVQLLTPVCKAWASDWGFRVADWCLQVYGGYGYTKDYPAEQYVRDARISPIYEGTNGIQALDLVGRKLPSKGGKAFRSILAEIGEVVAASSGDSVLGGAAGELGKALREVGEIATETPQREDGALLLMLNAVPFLDMFGHLLGGAFLLDQARLAQERLAALLAERGVDASDSGAVAALLADDADAVFLHNKVQSAVIFAYRALPLVSGQAVAIRAGERAAVTAVL